MDKPINAKKFLKAHRDIMLKEEMNFTPKQLTYFNFIADKYGIDAKDVPCLMIELYERRVQELEGFVGSMTMN